LFIDKKGKSDQYYVNGFINYLHTLTHDLNLCKLRNYGLDVNDLEKICAKAENKNNPVKLAVEDLTEIVLRRL
jgi:alcohol dehydrogenase class IV